jgi:regulator of sigma E protease
MNDSVTWNVIRSEGATIPFVVERNGQRIALSVVPYIAPSSGWRRKSVRQVLIYPATTPLIDKVQPNTPAAAAGLQHGDIITGFDGQRIYSPIALSAYVETHGGKPISFAVERLRHPGDLA